MTEATESIDVATGQELIQVAGFGVLKDLVSEEMVNGIWSFTTESGFTWSSAYTFDVDCSGADGTIMASGCSVEASESGVAAMLAIALAGFAARRKLS